MNISDVLSICPVELDKEDKDVIETASFYLPYSTGFEIECDKKQNADNSVFYDLNLLHIDINSTEQRFRITNGIEGLCQLYRIAQRLPDIMYFNPDSGIHYHIDFTDQWNGLSKELINSLSPYVLSELDKWNYQGTYNKRHCEFSESRHWTRFKSSTKTMEFRIGEMTFDYELLYKRITHCNHIVKVIKSYIQNPNQDLLEILYNINPDKIIKNRIIKI